MHLGVFGYLGEPSSRVWGAKGFGSEGFGLEGFGLEGFGLEGWSGQVEGLGFRV